MLCTELLPIIVRPPIPSRAQTKFGIFCKPLVRVPYVGTDSHRFFWMMLCGADIFYKTPVAAATARAHRVDGLSSFGLSLFYLNALGPLVRVVDVPSPSALLLLLLLAFSLPPRPCRPPAPLSPPPLPPLPHTHTLSDVCSMNT